MKEITIAPVFIKGLLEGAILKGYNPKEILQTQGVSPQVLNNPKMRVSAIAFAGLNNAVRQLTRDEAYGLLAKPSPFGTFDVAARACLSGETIKGCLGIWRDANNLFGNSVSVYTSFTSEGGYLALKVVKNEGVKSHFIVEALLTSVHRLHCWLANEYLPIEQVDLAYPEPEFSEEYRFVYYGAPVRFNQPKNAIHFSQKTLSLACHRDISELNLLLKNTQISLITQPKQSRSAYIRVRLWMENLIRDGVSQPLMKQAAEDMGLTEQTLRRYLHNEGYTFQELKDDTRRDMAIFFIDRKEQSIEEIAFRLGFSEASTFIRAFKKWTGLTPLAYRKLT
ncbi:AraC family transcriptional regulator [Paraglaciecola sp. 20A4]|uniref:AraC family transcriptional regulator n=1 Tax=Paraglaciecola sp. 20A4 TaxID=2687288 RepID=UPI00140E072B|nr:AraC family transcriptional regulator [Paraglaciecola sp. 20A4]